MLSPRGPGARAARPGPAAATATAPAGSATTPPVLQQQHPPALQLLCRFYSSSSALQAVQLPRRLYSSSALQALHDSRRLYSTNPGRIYSSAPHQRASALQQRPQPLLQLPPAPQQRLQAPHRFSEMAEKSPPPNCNRGAARWEKNKRHPTLLCVCFQGLEVVGLSPSRLVLLVPGWYLIPKALC